MFELVLRLLGDFETYNQESNDDFELIARKPIKPALTYVEVFRDLDSFEIDETHRPVEIGRCEIGFQWGTPWLYLHVFEISKSNRNKGYGRTFFEELKKFAKKHGFSYIWLYPKENDKNARDFWKHMGGVSINNLSNINLVPCNIDHRHLVFDLNADDMTQGA